MFSWLLSVGGVDSLLFGCDSGSEKILQNFFKVENLSTEKKHKHFTFVFFFSLHSKENIRRINPFTFQFPFKSLQNTCAWQLEQLLLIPPMASADSYHYTWYRKYDTEKCIRKPREQKQSTWTSHFLNNQISSLAVVNSVNSPTSNKTFLWYNTRKEKGLNYSGMG